MLSLDDRIEQYHQSFPRYPRMWVDREWLMGVWVLGNLWGHPQQSLYGAFPGNFLKRAVALFPDRTCTLHLFSGQLVQRSHEVTLDLLSHAPGCPAVCADARHLPFGPDTFDFVLADPPYSQADADHYPTKMISRGHVLREVRRVVQHGGHCAWLDTVRPMYSSKRWRQIGAIAVLVSTNTRVRCLSIFEAV